MVGIPDRKFGQAGHMHLYLPIKGRAGKTWLNNNIGAGYANLDSQAFNLAKQSTNIANADGYGFRYNYSDAKNSCPIGWRLPTVKEYEDEMNLNLGIAGWRYSIDYLAAFKSKLKLPNSGYTVGNYNYIYWPGTYGNYWTSETGACNTAKVLHIADHCIVKIYAWSQTLGLSTRCIQK